MGIALTQDSALLVPPCPFSPRSPHTLHFTLPKKWQLGGNSRADYAFYASYAFYAGLHNPYAFQ